MRRSGVVLLACFALIALLPGCERPVQETDTPSEAVSPSPPGETVEALERSIKRLRAISHRISRVLRSSPNPEERARSRKFRAELIEEVRTLESQLVRLRDEQGLPRS